MLVMLVKMIKYLFISFFSKNIKFQVVLQMWKEQSQGIDYF